MADDLLQGLREELENRKRNDDDSPEDVLKGFMEALENMPKFGEETENFMNNMKNGPEKVQTIAYLIFFSILGIIFLCFGFLIYKLYHYSCGRTNQSKSKKEKEQRKKNK
ncbi:uncharacterized protein LOC115876524 [Sitophilus oryzae]|uniref:Uncharacterized protein LOC115876524 n=1 Tax=Sitophilus oryzae TaxID=7048 RepID=A0A6J2XB77_SITOR|nr:uncharacterized protein LOC115876524 [Sitophilus oryzae]